MSVINNMVLTTVLFFISFLFPYHQAQAAQHRIHIKDCKQLQDMSLNSKGFYVLDNDLDCSSLGVKGFLPVALANGAEFDGQGHTISNLSIVANDLYLPHNQWGSIGLFSVIKGNVYVYDLTLKNLSIVGHSDSTVGGLVGLVDGNGNISNVHVQGKLIVGKNLGGLVGENIGGTIEKCSANVDIRLGYETTGGLVGRNFKGSVLNSFAEGFVSSVDKVGGLVGENVSGKIQNTYSKVYVERGDAKRVFTNLGGLVGQTNQLAGPSVIASSFAAGNISLGTSNIGVGSYVVGGAIASSVGIGTFGSSVGIGSYYTVVFDPKVAKVTQSAADSRGVDYSNVLVKFNRVTNPKAEYNNLDYQKFWKIPTAVLGTIKKTTINQVYGCISPIHPTINYICLDYLNSLSNNKAYWDYPHLAWEKLEDTKYYQDASDLYKSLVRFGQVRPGFNAPKALGIDKNTIVKIAKVDWKALREINGIERAGINPDLEPRSDIDWKEISNSAKAGLNWEDLHVASWNDINWFDLSRMRKEPINWLQLPFNGKKFPTNLKVAQSLTQPELTLAQLTDISKQGVNWSDLYVMSQTGINWEDVNVLTNKNINWEDLRNANIDLEKLNQSWGVNWTDLAVLTNEGVNWVDLEVSTSKVINWRVLDLFDKMNNWIDLNVLSNANVDWTAIGALSKRSTGINWIDFGILGKYVYGNWIDLAVLSHANVNWFDVAGLTDANINWKNIDLGYLPGMNWYKLSLISTAGINWLEVASLSQTAQDWHKVEVKTRKNATYSDWDVLAAIKAHTETLCNPQEAKNRPKVKIKINILGLNPAEDYFVPAFANVDKIVVTSCTTREKIVYPAPGYGFNGGMDIGYPRSYYGMVEIKKYHVELTVPVGAEIDLAAKYIGRYPINQWGADVAFCGKSKTCSVKADKDLTIDLTYSKN